MNKFYFLYLLLYAAVSNAQLTNGGTIIIQQGAAVFCAGNFTNASGIITNDGKLDVQGNIINSGTYNTPLNHDSLVLSGSSNTLLNSGAAVFQFLTINKAADSNFVTLAGSLYVGQKLDYLSGVLSTDYVNNPSYSLNAPMSAVFNIVAAHEIAGNVKRTNWVGGSTAVFNSANMQMSTSSGTAPSALMVTMLPGAYGGNPSQTEREVKRTFLFSATGGSGYTADIRFPYLISELNTNAEGNIIPWYMSASEWNAQPAAVTRDIVNHWVSITGLDITASAPEWKLADPRYTFNVTAYLGGSWNGVAMNASLNSILPATQPYNTPPFNYTGTENVPSIPSPNIVDWVLVELRKPATGQGSDASSGTIIGRKAGFLLNTGVVVDLDGATPIAFDISKQGASFITIRHRNHLGVMSNLVPSDTIGTFANDFSTLSNAYKAAGSPTDAVVPLAGGVQYGLWPGDANADGMVDITDVNVIKLAVSSSAAGYQLTDTNLSSGINATDLNVVKKIISASGSGSVPARVAARKIRTNIPDHIVE